MKILAIEFSFVSQVSCDLPVYKGSMFRGAFGRTLKTIACTRKENENCRNCPDINSCVCGVMFSAEDPSNPGQKDLPRPYVFRSDNFQTRFEKRQTVLKAELILFQNLIPLTRHFIRAMSMAAENGFGAQRTPFEMLSATLKGAGQEIVYNENLDFCKVKPFEILPPADLSNENSVKGFIEIDTPLFLKDKKTGKCRITGEAFFKSLFRRASRLSTYYADDEWHDFPFSTYFKELDRVEILSSDLQWVSFSRYSSTQAGEFPVMGYVGKIVLNNIPASLLEMLVVSEHIHLGKGAAWGFGKIRPVGFF